MANETDPRDRGTAFDSSYSEPYAGAGEHADHTDHPGVEHTIGARVAEGGKRALIWVCVAVVVVGAILFGWFLFGNWWTEFISSRAEGDSTSAIWFGVLIGFAAGLLAAIFLRLVFRRRLATPLKIASAILAAVALAPLIYSLKLTLAGGEQAATITKNAPGYQGGVLGGLIAAVVLYVVVWFALRRRRHAAVRAAESRPDVDLSSPPLPPPPPSAGPDQEWRATP